MIKMVVAGPDKPLLVLGLSGENMTRLMANEPVLLDTAALGLPPMKIVIVGGRTEDSILADLRQHFGLGKE